jgi:hypothetical protein
VSRQIEMTFRQLIHHFIPGIGLDTEAECIFAVEGVRALIETGGTPQNEFSRAFMDFYESQWLENLDDAASQEAPSKSDKQEDGK